MPMIRSEFSLDYTQSGLFLSVFNLAYGIGQMPAGWIADRIGRRIMITVGIAGVALFGLLVGFSHTYIMLVIFLGLMGLAGGGYHPAASPAVASSVVPERRGSALGIHLFGGSTSQFLAPLFGVAIATVLGWRGPYVVLAIPTFAFGIIFYLMMGRMPGLNKATQKTSGGQQSTVMETPGRIRHLVVFMVLCAFTQSIVFSVVSFTPLFLVDRFNVSEAASGAFMAIYYSTGLWASALGGYFSDRAGRVRLVLAVCLGSGISMYLLDLASFGIAMGAVMLLIGACGSIRMPVAESYIIRNTSEKRRSTVLGIYFFGGMEGGAVLTPFVGYLIDTLGFSACFTIASILVVVVVLICFFLLRGSDDRPTARALAVSG
jgi:FSR family fosmidomycin resistance protein-like MFS transporter